MTTFFGTLILPWVGVFGAGYLNLELESTWFKIRAAREDVLATQKQVEEIAKIALKAALVAAYGSTGFGGSQKEHTERLKSYIDDLADVMKVPREEFRRSVEEGTDVTGEIRTRAKAEFETRWNKLPTCVGSPPSARPCAFVDDSGRHSIRNEDGSRTIVP